MCEAHRRAYRKLLKEIEIARKEKKHIRLGELVIKIKNEASTIEIAPGRTVFDWINDELEAGNIRKIYLDEFEVR